MILLIECIIGVLLFTAIVLPIALINPLYVIGDYPPKIIEKCIELKIIPQRETRFTKKEIIKKIFAMILFVFIFASVVHRFNGARTFFQGFINAYIIWVVIAWYDALVLDLIFFCNLKRFRIPGTEDMKEYKDYLFHIKGSIRGCLVGLPACALIGLLVTLL